MSKEIIEVELKPICIDKVSAFTDAKMTNKGEKWTYSFELNGYKIDPNKRYRILIEEV